MKKSCMCTWLGFFLVLVLLFSSSFCFAEGPPDPTEMTEEEILAEMDENTAWMEGAQAAIEADKEDREALRSDVRYLIDLAQSPDPALTEIKLLLMNSNGESVINLLEETTDILEEATAWQWTEFTIGVGTGIVVMVIGGLLAPRILGSQ